MRFLIDQNLSPQIALLLREAGHDATHLRDLGLSSATDAVVLAAAHAHERILVSADTDFGGLLARSQATVPSVVLLRRLQERRASEQADLLLRHLDQLEEDLAEGCVVAFDEHRIRVRRLPL